MVASVIIRQRRLRNPRNTFWLGVIFCNLLAFANAVIEYIAFEQLNVTACLIFRITAGIPYTVNSFKKLIHHPWIWINRLYGNKVVASQLASGHVGSMGCFDLSAISSRNNHRQTCHRCSNMFLHSRHFTVYFTLLDQNDSADGLRRWSQSSRMDHDRLFEVISIGSAEKWRNVPF